MRSRFSSFFSKREKGPLHAVLVAAVFLQLAADVVLFTEIRRLRQVPSEMTVKLASDPAAPQPPPPVTQLRVAQPDTPPAPPPASAPDPRLAPPPAAPASQLGPDGKPMSAHGASRAELDPSFARKLQDLETTASLSADESAAIRPGLAKLNEVEQEELRSLARTHDIERTRAIFQEDTDKEVELVRSNAGDQKAEAWRKARDLELRRRFNAIPQQAPPANGADPNR